MTRVTGAVQRSGVGVAHALRTHYARHAQLGPARRHGSFSQSLEAAALGRVALRALRALRSSSDGRPAARPAGRQAVPMCGRVRSQLAGPRRLPACLLPASGCLGVPAGRLVWGRGPPSGGAGPAGRSGPPDSGWLSSDRHRPGHSQATARPSGRLASSVSAHNSAMRNWRFLEGPQDRAGVYLCLTPSLSPGRVLTRNEQRLASNTA